MFYPSKEFWEVCKLKLMSTSIARTWLRWNISTRYLPNIQTVSYVKCYVNILWQQVVMSAGTINTPQTLMLSGVGPRAHLQQMGISVIHDLPVGNNLQDHAGYAGLTFVVDKPVAIVQNRLQVTTNVRFMLDKFWRFLLGSLWKAL